MYRNGHERPQSEKRVRNYRMAADLERMVVQLDEPLADPAPLNVLYICQLAREQGLKILLSGAGGDDLFTGYRRHRAIKMERYWSRLPTGARSALESVPRASTTARPVSAASPSCSGGPRSTGTAGLRATSNGPAARTG